MIESESLNNDVRKLEQIGLEANNSAANTLRMLKFVLETKNAQYERDVPDAKRLFDQIELRINQTVYDAQFVANVTRDIAQLNKIGVKLVFDLRSNASQFGGWVEQLKITVANVTKEVEKANNTINSLLDVIKVNLLVVHSLDEVSSSYFAFDCLELSVM